MASGCYHIQNVNSLDARYKRFINPFSGPATKNLNGYICWLGGATGWGVACGHFQFIVFSVRPV
jgi:hypothetical protein